MPLSESDTRSKLIESEIHPCGSAEGLVRSEETAGATLLMEGKPRLPPALASCKKVVWSGRTGWHLALVGFLPAVCPFEGKKTITRNVCKQYMEIKPLWIRLENPGADRSLG